MVGTPKKIKELCWKGSLVATKLKSNRLLARSRSGVDEVVSSVEILGKYVRKKMTYSYVTSSTVTYLLRVQKVGVNYT